MNQAIETHHVHCLPHQINTGGKPLTARSTPRRSHGWAAFAAALLLLGLTGCGPEPHPPGDIAGSASARTSFTSAVLDDYSDAQRNRNGAERLLINDHAAGSHSRAIVRCENGVLSVHGDLVPGRGVPAFISAVSPLSAEGQPKDLTRHEGVRLRVRVLEGILCVQVATSTITNFDYHTSAAIAGHGSDFQEVRIPFRTLKRAWSEQVDINLKGVTSLNLVSFGLSRGAFAYAVDEIGFY